MLKRPTVVLGAGVLLAGLALPMAASADRQDAALGFVLGAAMGHAVSDHDVRLHMVHRSWPPPVRHSHVYRSWSHHGHRSHRHHESRSLPWYQSGYRGRHDGGWRHDRDRRHDGKHERGHRDRDRHHGDHDGRRGRH